MFKQFWVLAAFALRSCLSWGILALITCISCFATTPQVTVSATSQTLLGTNDTISLTATLIDPNSTGMLRVSGAGVITTLKTSTITAGTTATLGPIWGNDVIIDGLGNLNNTYYEVQVFKVNNSIIASTPVLQNFYAFTGSGTIDLATATPVAPSFMSGTNGNVSVPGTFSVTGLSTFSGGLTTPSTTFDTAGNGEISVPATNALTSAFAGWNLFNVSTDIAQYSTQYELGVSLSLSNPTKNSNVAVLGQSTIRGNTWLHMTTDGVFGGCNMTGAIAPTDATGSCSGIEGDGGSSSTGGFQGFLKGGTFNNGTISGSTNYREVVGVFGQTALQSGYTGIISSNFAGHFAVENLATNGANYSIFEEGNVLNCTGCHFDWLENTQTISSGNIVVSGCPGACLATVTLTSHGYSTNDIVEIVLGSDTQGATGFYKITRVDANTFTYAPIATANFTSAASATVARIRQIFGVSGKNLVIDANNDGAVKILAGASNANLRLGGNGNGAVNLNVDSGTSTGGTQFGDGAGNVKASVSSAGLGTFNGGLAAAGTAAGLTGTGACATLSSESAGSWSGVVTCTGTTGASTLVITPGNTAAHNFACFGSDETSGVAGGQLGIANTTCTLKFATVTNNDSITFGVISY